MKAVDLIIERIPFYAKMRGRVSDEAIVAHASATHPATTSEILTRAEVESGGFGFSLGDIFNTAKAVVKGVVGAGKGVVQAFTKKYAVGLTVKEKPPTPATIAAAAAAPKNPTPKKSPGWLVPVIIAAVIAVLVIIVVAVTGKAK